ncbi:CapA family protein [Ferruginivarius sediminum]|uniref:CapA family protein n=1 Tax=Ferruginivarius sediminum TaxID=2661937 RepID=A0A369TBP5_9PROT|nr:CapA family protein [Ferruginivarius sediminum]RDD62698.1 CapA family protein [Ferruginivarius sediminum]
MAHRDTITLFLCGDIMTGRGIDQILPHPARPDLHEPYVHSALDYLRLAEAHCGPIERPVGFAYVWGMALDELVRVDPDARIVNLETAVTRCEDWDDKGINYRMNPANVGVLTAARLDCCVLANNHVLDWGRCGLEETLSTLRGAGLRAAGAGMDSGQASKPAEIPLAGGGRVLTFAYALPSSGVPGWWAARADRPGMNFLPALDDAALGRVRADVRASRRPEDFVVVSLHWGGNFDFDIPDAQRGFAHALIDEVGTDVVHGHSSHHVKGIEVYRNRPIFYGCGDFLNDYEGIEGIGATFRDDLTCMYFPVMRRDGGGLATCKLTPLRMRRFRLGYPDETDFEWLRETLRRECARFGVGVDEGDGHRLSLRWS